MCYRETFLPPHLRRVLCVGGGGAFIDTRGNEQTNFSPSVVTVSVVGAAIMKRIIIIMIISCMAIESPQLTFSGGLH